MRTGFAPISLQYRGNQHEESRDDEKGPDKPADVVEQKRPENR